MTTMRAVAVVSCLAAGPARADDGRDLALRQVAVQRDRSPGASISIEVVNLGQEPHRFVVRAHPSRPGAAPFDLPSAAGHELAPGASFLVTIPAEDLRAGRNLVSLDLLQDGTRIAGQYVEYLKQVPGGLPDLKIVRWRRLSAGTYTFTVKNVGRADAPAFSVEYSLDRPTTPVRVSPDPAPALAPGQSFDFMLRDLPEHVPNPKKDRFNLLLHVDPQDRVAESNEENNRRTTGYGYNGSWAENHP